MTGTPGTPGLARRVWCDSGTDVTDEARAIERGLARVQTPPFAIDWRALDPALVASLRAQWRGRLQVEHRSAMVFHQLALQLHEAQAHLDECLVMMRMAQDELRHTRLAIELLAALGAEPEVEPLPLEVLAAHRGVPPAERALRNVVYTTCLSEMVACARFVAALEDTTDATMRSAMRALLADEVLHGRFGFHYLAARPDEVAACAPSLERYLAFGFAVLERELAPRPPLRATTAAERAYGVDDPAQARDVFYATIEHAIVPGLEQAGIGAESAWRARSLTPG